MSNLDEVTVAPAYGRTYASELGALADWVAGKDFRIVSVGRWEGKYCSIRDTEGAEGARLSGVLIRWNHPVPGVVRAH